MNGDKGKIHVLHDLVADDVAVGGMCPIRVYYEVTCTTGIFFPLTSVGMIASQEITRKFSTQRIQKEKQKQKFIQQNRMTRPGLIELKSVRNMAPFMPFRVILVIE